MKKRIFIAIELPEEIKQNLIDVQKNFQDLKAKWIKPEHMHLTMVFLGDVEEQRILRIEKICQKAVQELEPFEIEFIGLGGFPNSRRPHILWVGIENSEKLIKLQSGLASRLKNLGFKTENRKFTPHLTLARLKRRTNLKTAIEKFSKTNFGKMKVSQIHIFKSELGPEGPRHKKINQFSLT